MDVGGKMAAEYIERDAAKRIVDDIDTWASGWRDYTMSQLEAIPAADVREVVRCKDCKYNKTPDKFYAQCGFNYQLGSQDFFCRAGERRTNG